jgi:hypothetical protein
MDDDQYRNFRVRRTSLWDCRILLAIAKWMAPPVVILAMLAIYLGFVGLAWQRLRLRPLRARMLACALVENSTTRPSAVLSDWVRDSVNGHMDAESKTFKPLEWLSTPARSHDSSRSAGENASQFTSSAGRLIDLKDDQTADYLTTLDDLDRFGYGLSDQPVGEPSFIQRFYRDYYEFGGVAFRSPPDTSAQLRSEANRYLVFEGYISPTSSGKVFGLFEYLLPWRLFKFYDPKRVQLNEEIPFAFGTLLLTCWFLLKYRYYDEDIEGWFRGLVRVDKRANWVPLWEKNVAPDTPWKRRLAFGGSLTALALSLFVELVLNDPEVRAEWWVNVPVMSLTGMAMLLMWITITSLCRSSFSQELKRWSAEFFMRQIRPLIVGTICIVLGNIWMVLFSFLQLRGRNAKMDARSWMQYFVAAVSTALIIWLWIRIAQQYHHIGKNRDSAAAERHKEREKAMNKGSPTFLRGFVGENYASRLVVAFALLLLPIASTFIRFLGI